MLLNFLLPVCSTQQQWCETDVRRLLMKGR